MLDLHNFNMPKLKEEAYNRNTIRKDYLRQKGTVAVKNLKNNNFEAHYCDSIEEARKLVLSLIPDNGIIGCGDSHTVFALELDQELEKKNCVAIPHTCAVNNYAMEHNSPGFKVVGNKEEMRDILMQYLVANVFMLGANAITMDGQIINIDGAGNRIAGSLYGSDRIIVIAGVNKLVKDLNAGLDRIRFVAAQMNNIKYNNDLACNHCGSCMDCRSEQRNCNITSIIHKKPVDSDFHVIIIGEELGF
ncbi:lactate utilization protein [Clostridium aestuarii]|uniref:Lactate utilization protein n=1 Tax=Clostridium aestuarii TaxID=338193 RepID=A0ABT4D2I0_9CLOT|nr:lactate utilization protein [Clostridium aestuarii]MCY6485460.1 lactate utilization protein [Clostridium aestuarii]